MAKKKKKKAKRSGEVLVVGSKVKAYLKAKKCLTSGELVPALSDAVTKLLDQAAGRAKANDRKTVRATDI